MSKIEYLIDELGKIDDRFIDEALLPRAAANKKRRALKPLALVAAIVLVFAVSIAVIANMGNKKSSSAIDHNQTQAQGDVLYDEIAAIDAQTLATLKTDCDITSLLYGNTTRLIWTFDGEVYYSVNVYGRDVDTINRYLKNDRYQKADADDEFTNFRFWISYGDGSVTTPYLEKNSGRISYHSLSDYLPEVYPSGEFARFIATLISDQL